MNDVFITIPAQDTTLLTLLLVAIVTIAGLGVIAFLTNSGKKTSNQAVRNIG
jgi:hypothetical protein